MNHYIITGASGHIGNNLVRYIMSKEPDAKITALNRRNVVNELQGVVVEEVVGNLSDKRYLEDNINANDIVIHLAGYIDMKNKDYETSYNVNYLTTKNICDVCLEKHVKKFVYIGSVDAIYRTGREDVIVEPDRYYPERIKENYGKTKAMAMQYVLDIMSENKIFNAAMILPTAVIGIHDYKPSHVGKVIMNCINGKAEFGINGGYNFVDVVDVCSAIYQACNNEARGQYIVSGHNVSVKDMYEHINSYLGVRKKPIMIPMFLVWLCMPFVKVLNKVTIKALRDTYNYSCAKAEKELSYLKTDIKDTFDRTIKWFQENMDTIGK